MTTRSAPKPLISHRRGTGEMIVLKTFLLVPFAALLVAVPLVWGWGMTWVDLILAAVFYVFATLGVTVGYHRYFTHGAFKASRPLRVVVISRPFDSVMRPSAVGREQIVFRVKVASGEVC